MAYPSGNFSSANAAPLVVVFNGIYGGSTGSDWGAGVYSDIKVSCQVLNASGTVVGSGVMSAASSSVVITVDYPGGGAVWSATTTHLAHNINGPGNVSVDIRISARLQKR